MPLTIDQIKAIRFERPQYIPVSLGCLPAAWMKYRDQLQAIANRHPLLFGDKQRNYDDVWSNTYHAGQHTDAWGCVWSNVHEGREAMVTGHPLPRREDVRTLRPPTTDAGLPHGFMYLRLADLRGFEEIMIDFAEEPPELQRLLDIVRDYNIRQVGLRLAKWPATEEMIYFGDDLGTQHALPISPAKWRKFLKPCFDAIYAPVREKGSVIYMHTDGQCYPIIPDLVDCGVQVVNPQVRANGLDNLARVCKGKVCVDLDLDRQLFPFATPAEIDRHIREAVEALGSREGGLWLKAEIDDGVPLDNIEAVCTALEKYRAAFAN